MSELTDAFGRTVDSIGKSMDEMRTLLRQMLSNKDDLKTQKVAEEGNKSLEDLVDKLDDLTKNSEETIKVLKDVGDNMVKAIVDTRTGKSTPVTGKANVASKKDPTAATQDALGSKDGAKNMAEIEKSLKSITTMNSELVKGSAFAGMSLAITGVIRQFDLFSGLFEGVLTHELDYMRNMRAVAFETQGITAETRGLQEAYQATGKVVAEIGMNLSEFQKTYTKNLKGGVRSQKEMLTVTKASLSTATMIGSNAESTNDLFAKWHMQMGLTSNQASQLGRDVQTVARWTGVTGDNLIKVVQSSEKFVKSMRDAGTLTSQSAKNVMGLMAEAEKSGIGDQMERIVGAASNTYELFMKAGKETQSLMFAAASQVGKVNELRQGTLFQTRDGIKATADGMKNLMTQMGWVEDAASKLGGEELAQLNLRLQSAFGLQAGEVDRLIKSLDDGSKGYAERISDINKKLKEQNLTAEERLNLEKQGKKLAEDKGFEFLNAVEEAAKGAKSMDEAINKTFAKNKDMASDLGAMGVNLKSNMSAMQGAAMLSAKSIKEAGGKDFTKDIQKALSSGDMGKMREVIQAMHAESRKANVDQKKSLDPMSKMEQTLDLINESIRGFTGPMVRYFAGFALKLIYLGATLASAYSVLRSMEVGMKVVSDHFAKEDGVKGMDDPAGSGGIKGFIGGLVNKLKGGKTPGEKVAGGPGAEKQLTLFDMGAEKGPGGGLAAAGDMAKKYLGEAKTTALGVVNTLRDKLGKAAEGDTLFGKMIKGFRDRFNEITSKDGILGKAAQGFKDRFNDMTSKDGMLGKAAQGFKDRFNDMTSKDGMLGKATQGFKKRFGDMTNKDGVLGKAAKGFKDRWSKMFGGAGAAEKGGVAAGAAEKTQGTFDFAKAGPGDIGEGIRSSVVAGFKKLKSKFTNMNDKKGMLGMFKESLTKLKTKILPKTMEAAEAPTPGAGGGAIAEPKVPEIPSMKDMAKMGPSMLKIAAAVAVVGAAMLILVKIVGALGIDSGQVIETTKTIGAILVGAALIITAAGAAALAMKEVGKNVDAIKKAIPDMIKGAIVMAVLAPVMVLFAAGLIYFIDAMLGAMGVDAGKAEEVASNVAGILMSAGKILVATALAALVLVGVGTVASMLWGPQGWVFLGLMAAGAAALLVLAPVMVLLATSVVKFCDWVMGAIGVDASMAASVADEVSNILGSAASILWTTAKSAAMFLALGVAMALCIGPQGLILLRLMSLGAVALMVLAPVMAGLSASVVNFCNEVMGSIGIDAGTASQVADEVSGILGSAASILSSTAKSAAMFLALGVAMALCVGPQGLILLKLMSLGAVALMVMAPVMAYLAGSVVKFCMDVMRSIGIDGATAKAAAEDVETILNSAYEIMQSIGKAAAVFLGAGAATYMLIGPQGLILGGLMLLGAAALMFIGPKIAALAAGIAMMVVSVLRSNIPNPNVLKTATQVMQDISTMVEALGNTIGTMTQVLVPMVAANYWKFWDTRSPLQVLQDASGGIYDGLSVLFDFLGETGDRSIIPMLIENFPNTSDVKTAGQVLQDVAVMAAAIGQALDVTAKALIPLTQSSGILFFSTPSTFDQLNQMAIDNMKDGLSRVFAFLGSPVDGKGDSIIAMLIKNFPNTSDVKTAGQVMQDVAMMASGVATALDVTAKSLIPLTKSSGILFFSKPSTFDQLNEKTITIMKDGLSRVFAFLGSPVDGKGDSIIAMLIKNFPNTSDVKTAGQVMEDVAMMASGIATALDVTAKSLIPLTQSSGILFFSTPSMFDQLNDKTMSTMREGLSKIFAFLGSPVDGKGDSIIAMLIKNFPNTNDVKTAAQVMEDVATMAISMSAALDATSKQLGPLVEEPAWYNFWRESPFTTLEKMTEPIKTGFGQLANFINSSILEEVDKLPETNKMRDAANKLSAVADAMLSMSAALQAMGDAAKGFKSKRAMNLADGGFWSTITGLFGFGGGASGADIGKGLLNPSSAEKAQASIDDARKKTETTGDKIKDSLYKKGVQAQAQDVNKSAKQTEGVVGDNMSGATEALQSSLEEFNGGIDKSVDDVKSSLERAKNKVSGVEAAAAAGGAAGEAAASAGKGGWGQTGQAGSGWGKPSSWSNSKATGVNNATSTNNIPTYKSDLQESEATLAQREKDKVSFRDALQFSGNDTPAEYGGGGGGGGGGGSGGGGWGQKTRWGMAKGGSFVAKQATPLTVGEKGLERVTVTPGNNIPDLETKTASMAEAAANKAAMTIPAARAGGIQSSPLSDAYDRMGQQQAGAEAGTQQIKSDELVSIDNATNKQVEHLGDIHETLQDIKRLLTPNLGSMSGASPTPLAGSTAPQTSSFGSTDYGKWQFGRHGGNANSQVLNDGTS